MRPATTSAPSAVRTGRSAARKRDPTRGRRAGSTSTISSEAAERERDLVPGERRGERGDREDAGRDRDGDRQDVVGEQRRGADEGRKRAEVLPRDDVRAAARLVRRTVCMYETTTIASSSAIAIEIGKMRCARRRRRQRAGRRERTRSRRRPTRAGPTRRSAARASSGAASPRAAPSHRAANEEPPEGAAGAASAPSRFERPVTRRSARREQSVGLVRVERARRSRAGEALTRAGRHVRRAAARRRAGGQRPKSSLLLRAAGRLSGDADGSRAGSSESRMCTMSCRSASRFARVVSSAAAASARARTRRACAGCARSADRRCGGRRRARDVARSRVRCRRPQKSGAATAREPRQLRIDVECERGRRECGDGNDRLAGPGQIEGRVHASTVGRARLRPYSRFAGGRLRNLSRDRRGDSRRRAR